MGRERAAVGLGGLVEEVGRTDALIEIEGVETGLTTGLGTGVAFSELVGLCGGFGDPLLACQHIMMDRLAGKIAYRDINAVRC